GCQQSTSVVAKLPPPSFSAPAPVPQVASVPQPYVAPRPNVQTKPRIAPAPRADAVPAGWVPPVRARPWRWIVIHHSATPTGGAAAFDKMHKAKGWDELGYDFVIGNGTDTKDGLIEVGPRWTKQKIGAHARTADNRFNEFGIGICLVGNFDIDRPTAAQVASLTKLTAYLMKSYRIGQQNIVGHGDTKATDCPGKYMPIATIRANAARQVAESGGKAGTDPTRVASSTELMTPAGGR
ncbi:MAG TPA: peptidoglycan recognition family protein, partial [Tepidisphaeraceae bacterium]|nr:peptidoglycan recognition family protein [Tepidisphaeraceae bacterium]